MSEIKRRHISEKGMESIRLAVRSILRALGDDPDREGLIETPDRVARMYDEVFEGMAYSNEEIAAKFNKCFDEPNSENMVVVRDIEAFSYCEHHLALMYNMSISVAYIPSNGKVIGLSKLARIVDMVCKRLQLQERIVKDIAEIVQMVVKTNDIMVVVKGEHSCMTARGIKKPGASTCSAIVRGLFKESSTVRDEAYRLMGM